MVFLCTSIGAMLVMLLSHNWILNGSLCVCVCEGGRRVDVWEFLGVLNMLS